jgi:hypothetical protein
MNKLDFIRSLAPGIYLVFPRSSTITKAIIDAIDNDHVFLHDIISRVQYCFSFTDMLAWYESGDVEVYKSLRIVRSDRILFED